MLFPALISGRYCWMLRLLTFALTIVLYSGIESINTCKAQHIGSSEPFRVEDWFGLKHAKPRIGSDPQVSTTVILADYLDLSGRTYSYIENTAPKNVIIIADTLELRDLAVFDLSAKFVDPPQERSAGQLVIFARHFICSEKAQIVFRGLTRSFAVGPNQPRIQAGRFFFGIESLELSSELKQKILTRILMKDDIIPEGKNKALTLEIRSQINTLIKQIYKDTSVQVKVDTFLNTKTFFDEDVINFFFDLRSSALDHDIHNDQGQVIAKYLTVADISVQQSQVTPGVFRTADNAESLMQYTDYFKIAFSKWAVHWIRNMENRINASLLLNDQSTLYDTVSKVQEFIRTHSSSLIDATYQDAYSQHLENIHYKVTDKLVLYREALDINILGWSSTNIDIFAEGSSQFFKAGPTTLLLREMTIDGLSKIGFCRYDPSNPKELEFYITGDLNVDPYIAIFIEEELKKRRRLYSGLFRNWDLSSFGFNALPGIVGSNSSIVVNDSSLQAKLVFGQSGIGLIKWSTEGLPVHLKWVYSSDPKITGTFRNVLLKRTVRKFPEIITSGTTVKNVGKSKMIIRYAIAGERQIINFTPFIEVNPGESVNLPLPSQVQSKQITIPPSAVEYICSNYLNFGDDFYIVYSDQMIEEITVSNKLTINAVASRDLIEYIDVNISAGARQEWKIKLLPYPNRGSSDKRWFLRGQNQERQLSITGRIHYKDGSFDDLKPQVTNYQEILIGLESLS